MRTKLRFINFFLQTIGKKRYSVFLLILLAIIMIKPANGFSQSGIPPGSCGIEYIYDAAGNMIERHYICNNSGSGIASLQMMKAANQTSTFQAVSALYPNPTTGKFTVQMVKSLQSARVEITNAQGSVISTVIMSGDLLSFDLSGKASGIYFIRIYDKETVLSAQVIKQ